MAQLMNEREINYIPPEENEGPQEQGLPDSRPAEFEFHQQRLERKAKKFGEKRLGREILDEEARQIAKDFFAHEEAIREDANYERRRTAEFQAWEKNLHRVTASLLKKRDLPSSETKEIRPLLIMMGGGMQGPYGAGQLLGLHEMGLGGSFDTVVGISAGSATAGMFVAGHEQSKKAASIFMEECTTKEFINFRRIHQILDIRVLERTLRKGSKALDEQAIKDSHTNFYVGVTNKDTGESELIDAKTARPDMVTACAASAAAPIVFREAVEVNDTKYIDGGFDPMPIEKVIEKFQPTDVLVLPNTPFDRLAAFKDTLAEYLFMGVSSKMGSFGSMGTIEKFLRNKEQFRKDLEFMQKEHSINIGILWPPDSGLSRLTTDPDQIKAAILDSVRATISEFGEKQPHEIQLDWEKRPTTHH